MASIVGKRIKGQTDYYLREVARVGGRPKIVSQCYLGKAADLAAAVDGAVTLPERTRLWALARWPQPGRCSPS